MNTLQWPSLPHIWKMFKEPKMFPQAPQTQHVQNRSYHLSCVSFNGYIWLPKLKAFLHQHSPVYPQVLLGQTQKVNLILYPPFFSHCPASVPHPLLTRLCQWLLADRDSQWYLLELGCYCIPAYGSRHSSSELDSFCPDFCQNYVRVMKLLSGSKKHVRI